MTDSNVFRIQTARIDVLAGQFGDDGLPRVHPEGLPLKGSGGGGTSGGMEARVAKLESDMDHVKKTVDRIDGKIDALIASTAALSTSLATITERTTDLPAVKTTLNAASSKIEILDERTKHLPTKTFIWVCVGGISGVVAVLSRLIDFK